MPNVNIVSIVKGNSEKGWKSLLPQLTNALPLDHQGGTGNEQDEESDGVMLPRRSIFNYGLHPSQMEGRRHYYICKQCKMPLKTFNLKAHMLNRHANGSSVASCIQPITHSNSNSSSQSHYGKSKKSSSHSKRKPSVPPPPLFSKNIPPPSAPSSVEEMSPPVLHPEAKLPHCIAKQIDASHSKATAFLKLQGSSNVSKVVPLANVPKVTAKIIPAPPLPSTASIIVSLPTSKKTVLPVSALELAKKTVDKDKKGHIVNKTHVEAKTNTSTSSSTIPKEPPKRGPRKTRSSRTKKDYDPNKHCGVMVKDKGPCMRSPMCTTHHKPFQLSERKKMPGHSKSDDSSYRSPKEKHLYKVKNSVLPRVSMPPPRTLIKGFRLVSDPVTNSSVPETLPSGTENNFVEAATLPTCDLESKTNLYLAVGQEACDSKGRVQLKDISRELPSRPVLLKIPDGSVLTGLTYASHPKPMTMRAFPYMRRFAHLYEQQARQELKMNLKRQRLDDTLGRDAKQSKAAASSRVNGFLFRPSESPSCFQDKFSVLKQLFFSDFE